MKKDGFLVFDTYMIFWHAVSMIFGFRTVFSISGSSLGVRVRWLVWNWRVEGPKSGIEGLVAMGKNKMPVTSKTIYWSKITLFQGLIIFLVVHMNSTPQNTYFHQILSWLVQEVQSYGSRMVPGGPQLRVKWLRPIKKVASAGVEPKVENTLLLITSLVFDLRWKFWGVYGKIGCRTQISP